MGFVGTLSSAQVLARGSKELNAANNAIISAVEVFREECRVDFDAALNAYSVNVILYLVAAWRRGHPLAWRDGIGGPLLAIVLAAAASSIGQIPGAPGLKLVLVWVIVLTATGGIRAADLRQILDLLRSRGNR